MKSKLMLTVTLIFIVSLLSGCFGGGEVVDDTEKKKFDSENALSREEKEKLDKSYDKIMGSNNEDIKAADYMVKQVFGEDLEKDYYYGGILNMDIDTIFQQQLKYFEVHREYMIYLEKTGASKEDLILYNRKFNYYLETFKGRQFDGKDHVKRTLEKIYYQYNVLEIETILKGESVTELVKTRRSEEAKNGMWDWLRDEENANFDGNILVFTKVIFDLLEPSDKDIVTKYLGYIKEVDELISTDLKNAKVEVIISNLNSILEKVEKERLNKDVEWMKAKVSDYIIFEINRMNVLLKGNEFKLAQDEFFIDIYRQETLVTINLLEDELAKQEEKRKALKEKKEKEKEKEKVKEKE